AGTPAGGALATAFAGGRASVHVLVAEVEADPGGRGRLGLPPGGRGGGEGEGRPPPRRDPRQGPGGPGNPAVLRQVAEEVIRQPGVLAPELVGLRDVHRHPGLAVRAELGPAVVAADRARAALGRQGEADLELGRQLVGAGQRDEQAVEVGAVAVAAAAPPDRVALPPARPLLAVLHVAVDYVVQQFRQPHPVRGELLALQQRDRLAADRHFFVRLEEEGDLLVRYRHPPR